ncbi:MAG: peptidylprolyl isomerase, partial [Bacteroidales bacterium]
MSSIVTINTTLGNIQVKLYDETPLHRDNFLKLVKEKYYEGTIFHRVINGFMIQAGDPLSKGANAGKSLGTGGPGYTIPAEIVYPQLFHKRGVLAAARQGDAINPKRASSGSQFYIVCGEVYSKGQIEQMEKWGTKFTAEQIDAYSTVGGTPHLDGQYTVFGEVIEGMNVV